MVLIVYYVSDLFNLYTLNALLGEFLASIFLVVVILFKNDIRKALASVGTKRFWTKSEVRDDTLDHLTRSVMNMSSTSTGAIIVIEKSMPLGDIIERGIELDAKVNQELIETIFVTDTPLHDGASFFDVTVSWRRPVFCRCLPSCAGNPCTAHGIGRLLASVKDRTPLRWSYPRSAAKFPSP